MRQIFYNSILLLCVVFIQSTFAQNKPKAPSRRTVVVQGNKNIPPPAPLIYKAPEKNDLKEFVSDDGTFRITFPGVPKITRQKVENGTAATYLVYRQGSNSIVNVADFDIDIESGREEIYASMRNDFLKSPKTTIEAEKDIRIGGEPGREFDILQNFQYQKIRVLIVGARIYEIKTDATNWHIAGDSTKKQFFSETERFFDSFSHNKFPEKSVPQVPEGFLGAATDSSYKNTFFNFALDFPGDWHNLDEAEMKANQTGGLKILETAKEKVNKAFEEAALKETAILMIAQRNSAVDKGSSLTIGVLKQPNNQVSAEMSLAASKNFFLANPKIKIVKDVEKIELNGTRFAAIAIETNVSNNIVSQKLLTTIRKGYSITFVLTYLNGEGLKSLEKIIASSRFDSK